MHKPDQYERLGTIPIEDVLPYLGRGLPPREYFGKSVKMGSLRYRVFSEKGTTCVKCGIEGKYFALERAIGTTSDKWHFNLYGEGDALLTKDHIIPRCKGGTDSITNLQTMCAGCNNKKADSLDGESAIQFAYILCKSGKPPLIKKLTRKPRLKDAEVLIRTFAFADGRECWDQIFFGPKFDLTSVLRSFRKKDLIQVISQASAVLSKKRKK